MWCQTSKTHHAEPRIARLTNDFLQRTAFGKSDSGHRHSTAWSGAAMHMARSTTLHILHPPDMPESKIRRFTFGSRIPKADKRLHALMKAEHHPTLELALQVARDGVGYKSETMDLQERSIWQHFKFRLMTQPIFGMHSNGCESVLGEHVQRYHMCHLPQSIQNLSPDIVIHCLWTAPIWLLCWNLVPVVISCFTPMLCRPWCKSNWV